MTGRSLNRGTIGRLKAFQSSRRLSISQLKLTMNAPFSFGTLDKALYGMPLSVANYQFIVHWVDQNLPEKVADGKASAANDAVPCSE